jgi:xanthine dehydrogenase accessory factor
MFLFDMIIEKLKKREPIALVTVISTKGSTPRKAGAKMLVGREGLVAGSIGGGHFEHKILSETLSFLDQGGFHRRTFHLSRDLAMCCGGTMEVSMDVFSPSPRLFIFGAGHIAREMAPLGQKLDFETYVLDEREDFLKSEHFAEGIQLLDDMQAFRREVPLEKGDCCLVMTSDHQLDQKIIEMILSGPLPGFIGLIGSASKWAKFKKRLEHKKFPLKKIETVTCPVGLDLGGQGPMEIALSIAAQLVKRRYQEESRPRSQ